MTATHVSNPEEIEARVELLASNFIIIYCKSIAVDWRDIFHAYRYNMAKRKLPVNVNH